MEYTAGGTISQDIERWVNKDGMPLYSMSSQVNYLLSISLVTLDDGLLPDLAPYAQDIFSATSEITSEDNWAGAASYILPLLDGKVNAQPAQIYQAQPPPNDISPSATSFLHFKPALSYPGHHLDD